MRGLNERAREGQQQQHDDEEEVQARSGNHGGPGAVQVIGGHAQLVKA